MSTFHKYNVQEVKNGFIFTYVTYILCIVIVKLLGGFVFWLNLIITHSGFCTIFCLCFRGEIFSESGFWANSIYLLIEIEKDLRWGVEF